MRKIGVGIVGWGFMGKTHAYALRTMPLHYPGCGFVPELRGVCAHKMQDAQAAQEQLGFPFATDSLQALLTRPDIDVVSVCTPNSLHEEMGAQALRAGKHLYIDKPLAATLEGARRLYQVYRDLGEDAPLCQVALHNRFFPAVMRARQLAEQGMLGEIVQFRCAYLHSGSLDPNRPIGWKQDAREGGVLLDMGSHALDLAAHIVGPPARLRADSRVLYPARPTKEGGVTSRLGEDHILITLALSNGALGTVEASKIATGAGDEMHLEVCGTKGALRFSLEEPDVLWYFDQSVPEAPLGGMRGFVRIECGGRFPQPGGQFLPPKNTVGWVRAHIHSYFSFLSAIHQNGRPSPSLFEGLELQRWMDSALLSCRQGGWIDL